MFGRKTLDCLVFKKELFLHLFILILTYEFLYDAGMEIKFK